MQVRMRGFASYTRLADALKIVLSNVKRLGSEPVSFDRAVGRVLAQNVISKTDVPPFDRSGVDGYAVRARDTFRASELKPVRLRLIGSADVGRPSKLVVWRGEAVKIMTGAQMPKGADAVVMVEHTRAEGSRIEVLVPLTPGKNVSARGEDVKAGDVVLERGRLLRPQEVGMLASTGNIKVLVSKRPRVGILATGSELQKPGPRVRLGKIADTNSYSLAAAVIGCGGLPSRMGAVADELALVRKTLERVVGVSDLVLVSGGASVGEHDVVPDAIAGLGELFFHGVAIRPGAPTAFGAIKGKPVFSLPGFPVSALVAFDLLVRPALRHMQGLPAERGFTKVRAKLSRKVSSTLGRAEVVRVKLRQVRGELLAEPLRITGSGVLSSMTKADGFVLVPEDVEGLEAGSEVGVELYRC